MTDKDIVSDIIEAENQSLSLFQPKWDEADRNAEMYGLDLWTKEEKDKFKEQGRIPYNLDRTNHAIGTLLGAQREGRTDIFFYPQSNDDELRTELYNAVWKYFANLYQYESVESDVFADGLVAKYGVFGCEIDKTRDPRGNVKVFRVPYNEILWDRNFREYGLDDAYWMSRMRFYQKDEMTAKYPDRAEIVKMAGQDWGFTQNKVRQDRWYKPDKGLVGAREFYEKAYITKWFIWQSNAGELLPDKIFKSKEEAEEFIGQLNAQYVSAVLMGQADPMTAPSYEPQDFPITEVKKTVVVINGVLEEPHIVPLGDYPFSVYFPYFYDGDFWSAVDRIKDPQRFESRMFAQADHWISVMAKGLLVGSDKIPDAEWKKITEMWGKTGGAVRTKWFKDILPVVSPGPAPQLFSLIDRAGEFGKETFGGANMLGLKQTASESGRAVLARQAQANLDNLVPLSNLSRTKHSLGTKLAWYISQITAPRVLRIVGDDIQMESLQKMGEYFKRSESRPSQGYLTINTEQQNSLEGLLVDVIVDEAQNSPTKNIQVLNQLTDFGKTGLLASPPPVEAIIQLLPVPYSFKQTWLQSLQKQEPPPPADDISINFKDLPPATQEEVLKKMGLNADKVQLAIKQIFDKSKPNDSGPDRQGGQKDR